MNKTVKILLVTVVTLLIIVGIGKKLEWFGKKDRLGIESEWVELRTIVETVSANGKIQPEVEVKISPDVSGEIIELAVKEGDEVKVGDLLLKINPDIYVSSVDRMDAALNTSKANLATTSARFIEAESTFNRNKKLWKEQVISDATFETIKANMDVAKQNMIAAEFNIKSANASLKEARDNLAKTMIFAPVSGTVYMLRVEKGERVVGTSQMAGTELMRLANLNEMEVSVEVNENDIVSVSVGDITDIEVDAYLDRKFMGKVTEVANSANTDGVGADQVTNFTVKIRILQSSYEDLLGDEESSVSPFRPGMSATVEIQTETQEGIIAIPIQAVTIRADSSDVKTDGDSGETKKKDDASADSDSRNDDEESYECVFVFDDGKAVMYKVETGIQDNDYIEVRSGVEVGMRVIIGPYTAISKKLKDGKEIEEKEDDDD
ncbi:MAG: efflux transporter periplasmic adaptor subunit [Bacteroidetes bacterium]|nr:MAG: efflux transporter periplasmic adaptor subunit [Bacteroidota bacterium]